MASFEDLAPFTLVSGERLVAVGWLDPKRPFPTAPPDPALVRGLRTLSLRRQPPGAPTEPHRCPFCETNPRSSSRMIVVFGEGVAYVAPELIGHYVQKHSYAPPSEFARAALAQVGAREQDWEAFVRHFPSLEALNDYPAAQIHVLDSLMAVRARPAMYISGTDARGLLSMMEGPLGNAVNEHLSGNARRVDVRLQPDGWIEVEDDGPGIRVDEATPDSLSSLPSRFSSTHGFGRVPETPRVQMLSLAVAATNALSQRFEVETRPDGNAWRLAFETARLVEPLAQVGPTSARGTRIRYLADDEVFDTIHLDVTSVEARLGELAQLLPDLELHFQGKPVPRHATLADWLATLVPGIEPRNAVSGRRSFGDAIVDFAVSWRPNASAAWVRAFANWGEAGNERVYVDALLDAMTQLAPEPVRCDAFSRGLVGLVHVALPWPVSAAREAGPAVLQVVREALTKNPTFWDWLLENVSG